MSNLDERINKNGKIKSINIVFENLEVVVVPSDYISAFVINDISENFVYTNTTLYYFGCKKLNMRINNEFNMTLVDDIYGERNSFQRIINFNDIVAVDIIFENDVSETVYVDWWDMCEYENLNQSTEILSDGSLSISIDDENNEEEKISFLQGDLGDNNDENE